MCVLPQVGQFNTASGLKCSCGLHASPAFKVARQRVDAMLPGLDTLTLAVSAQAEAEQLGSGEDSHAKSDEAGPAKSKPTTKALRVPVSKHRGNFSEFRNKTT
jgi:hypothetical protein